MTTTETPAERIARIKAGFSQNDVLAIMAFADAGIDPDDITPRENVFTFNAWKDVGRQVAKGANGIPVTVWVPKKGKGKDAPAPTVDGKPSPGSMFPKTTRLFHISQTLPLGTKSMTVKPAAWANPALIKPIYTAEDGLPVDGAPVTVTAPAIPPAEPVSNDTGDDFGKLGDDRPAACSCPMVGVMTNVDCPLHGHLVTA